MPNKKKHTRIFISSPRDVDVEREIVYKVISDTEDFLQSLRDHDKDTSIPPLRAIGWEQVSPGVGLPNNIILDRFPIEESHIFIFILWKRFGSPPGTRKRNVQKYMSGTEEEFDKAYTANKQNGNGVPFIMVCQKKDEFLSPSLTPREIRQYGKVVKFIEDCQPNGKHPAFFKPFFAKEFENTLRKHLFETLLNLRDTFKDPAPKSNNEELKPVSLGAGQISEPVEENHPSLLNWLKKNNLNSNPFKHHIAEDENEKERHKYYVPFTGYPLIANDVIQRSNNWLFFGEAGSGKTALKQLILSWCAPSRANSRNLAFTYETSHFREALEGKSNDKEILSHIASQILGLVPKPISIPIQKQSEIKDSSDPIVILSRLGKFLHETKGYERSFILLDLDIVNSDESALKYIQILSNLVSLSIDKLGFRLFLPKGLRAKFTRQGIYLGKCNLHTIRWRDKDLKELIKRRLIHYSINKTIPRVALAALCEPKGKMRSIDDEIVALSQGRPRAVVWLANKLLMEHCQNEPVPPQISSQSWDKVLLDWWATGRNLILGPSGNTESFFTDGTEVYFGTPDQTLKLSKRSKLLLKLLVEAEGEICTRDELIRFAWPGDNSDGVTEGTVHEAIRRLRNELKKKNGIDPSWIKTIYGQGYQLQETKGDIINGRDATNSVIIQGSHHKVNLRMGKRTGKEDS